MRAAAEAGLPIPYTEGISFVGDTFGQSYIQILNTAAQLQGLDPIDVNVSPASALPNKYQRLLNSENYFRINRVKQTVTGNLTGNLRTNMILSNYNATPDERMRTTGDQYMSYMTNDLGLSTNHALGLLANMIRESSLRPAAPSGDDGGAGGLFQWYAGRQTPYVQQIVNSGDWKQQIEYALREPGEPGPEYLQQDFATPQEAADWWMRNWERPAHPDRDSLKHTEILRHWVN